MKKEFIEAISNGNAYDFICNNYYKFSQMELADILKEFVFLMVTNDECKKHIPELIENIESWL